jgi:parallel beta-helix repeat protein
LQKGMIISLALAVFLAFSVFSLTIPFTHASSGAIINEDGSISPEGSSLVTANKVTYTLTGDIEYGYIEVKRDNVEIDGAGHTISGSDHGGVMILGKSGVTIKNLIITGCEYGVELDNACPKTTITGNNITRNRTAGIRIFSSGADISITGNKISNNGAGIDISAGGPYTIADNNFEGDVGGMGIFIANTDHARITDNLFVDCGLFLGGSNTNLAVQNNAVNGKPLVYLEAASGKVIDNAGQVILVNSGNNMIENLVFGRQYAGVSLFGCQGITVRDCTFKDNHYGLFLSDSTSNIFFNNNLMNNYFSVQLLRSSNNKFYHNTFIDVTVDNSANSWDNGYPSGGNYWTAYHGQDIKSGPNQDQPGSDGIGDTEFTKSAIVVDKYPLMRPVASATNAAPTPTATMNPQSSSPENQPPQSDNILLIIGGAVVAIIAVAGTVVYFVFIAGGHTSGTGGVGATANGRSGGAGGTGGSVVQDRPAGQEVQNARELLTKQQREEIEEWRSTIQELINQSNDLSVQIAARQTAMEQFTSQANSLHNRAVQLMSNPDTMAEGEALEEQAQRSEQQAAAYKQEIMQLNSERKENFEDIEGCTEALQSILQQTQTQTNATNNQT